MALNTSGITSAIASLSVVRYGSTVATINIKNVTALDPHVEARDCPILFPAPGDWKGGASGSPAEETTFGTPSTRMWIVHQTFKYIFIQAQAGTERDINDYYNAASYNVDALWTALTALDVSGVDVENINTTPIGVLEDPTGTNHVGCIFQIALKERINA